MEEQMRAEYAHVLKALRSALERERQKRVGVSVSVQQMISIYSTCKRISQKILRNVQKFALLIADADYASLNFGVKFRDA
jgi:hypothetical protein